MGNFILIVCYVVFFTFFIDASTITFTASPRELKANLTDAAAMRCSLRAGGGSGDDEIQRPTSIFIKRNNDSDVASITDVDPPTALADLGNLEVKGSISALSTVGYLELSWKDPSKMATGSYTCHVSGIGLTGNQTMLRGALSITRVSPTVNDVIESFKQITQDAQSEMRALTQELAKQKQEVSNLNQHIAGLQTCSTPPPVAFMAVMPNGPGYSYTLGVNTSVVYKEVLTDTAGAYDNTTGEFTCTTPGVYVFSVSVLSYPGSCASVNMKLNNQTVTSALAYKVASHSQADSSSATAVVVLRKGDVVQVIAAPGCAHSKFYLSHNVMQANTFSGHLLHSNACLNASGGSNANP